MKRLIIVIIAAVALLWLASQLTAIITTTQPPSHQTPGAVGQTAKSNATAAEHGNTATESRRAPPGWKIEVVEQYVVEYPGRRVVGGVERYVFYFWNGSLYCEDSPYHRYDNPEYAYYVGRVTYIEPRNETLRKIWGQNPLVYTQYNITYYPLWSYTPPRANMTIIKFKDIQIINSWNYRPMEVYNLTGEVPKAQVAWLLEKIAWKLTNNSVLGYITAQIEIPEPELLRVDKLTHKAKPLACVNGVCAISPKVLESQN
ncbi:hypothetical protein [Pyrobaculum sp.]|uniref:hypothetical protein n=1 Tax=Pyrobaculum sp. TaxID=2004705 RepID=UPI003163AABC